MQPGFMTVMEVAKVMRVSKMTVYRLVHSGEIPSVRLGRSFRIAKKDVEAYLENAKYETTSYADKVNAPLSEATAAALKDELASGNYARFRKTRPEKIQHFEMTEEEFEEGKRLSLARLGLTYEELEAMANDRGGNFTSTAAHVLWVAIGGGYGKEG